VVLKANKSIMSQQPSYADKWMEREKAHTMRNTSPREKRAMDEEDHHWVSLERATLGMSTMFEKDPPVLAEALQQANSQAIEGGNKPHIEFKKLEILTCEMIALGVWEGATVDASKDMEEMFKKADENQDGVLSFDEFSGLVTEIRPDLGLLEVLAIFREAIQESESDAGDVITPNAFASVMKDHGVMPGTKVPSANPKGNKSGGLKKMGRDAFKVDFALLPDGVIEEHSDRLRQCFLSFASTSSPPPPEAGDDVDGLMDCKQWMEFLSKVGVLNDDGLTEDQAEGLFVEANGERLSKDTSENKELTITKDEDEEHLNYDEFVYAVALSAHSLYSAMPSLADRMSTLFKERIDPSLNF